MTDEQSEPKQVGLCIFPPETPLPSWFGSGTATQCKMVARGLHPMGRPLGPENETCGSCALMKRRHCGAVYLKCSLVRDTNGPGTDIRAKWRACDRWQPKEQP